MDGRKGGGFFHEAPGADDFRREFVLDVRAVEFEGAFHQGAEGVLCQAPGEGIDRQDAPALVPCGADLERGGLDFAVVVLELAEDEEAAADGVIVRELGPPETDEGGAGAAVLDDEFEVPRGSGAEPLVRRDGDGGADLAQEVIPEGALDAAVFVVAGVVAEEAGDVEDAEPREEAAQFVRPLLARDQVVKGRRKFPQIHLERQPR